MMMVVVDFNHRPTTLNLDLEDNIMMMITMMMVMIMIMMMVVAGYLKRRLHTGKFCQKKSNIDDACQRWAQQAQVA